MPREKSQASSGLGEFIRNRRNLANLSMRELARLAEVSNPYLSQIERGIYKPSAKVLKAIAEALQVSAETLYTKVGLLEADPDADLAPSVEDAVRADDRLSADQKKSLLQVYRSFVEGA
jgi:transcriptional regulator with XRE-family HTH domain